MPTVVGRRFFEPVCPHDGGRPFTLSPDPMCTCGIYFQPRHQDFLLDWLELEAESAGGTAERAHTALTFGVVGIDPLAPDGRISESPGSRAHVLKFIATGRSPNA